MNLVKAGAEDDLVTLSVKIKKGRFTTNTADGKMFIDGKSCSLPQDGVMYKTQAIPSCTVHVYSLC